MCYSVAKVKNWQGREGAGYQGDLLRDGKVVGFFHQDGNGGEIQVDFFKKGKKGEMGSYDREEEKLFNDVVAALPEATWPESFGGGTYQPNSESYICDLLDIHDRKQDEKRQKQWYKRNCANSTLFRLKGDSNTSWRTIAKPFSTVVKEHLVTKHGDNIEEIANETRL